MLSFSVYNYTRKLHKYLFSVHTNNGNKGITIYISGWKAGLG